MSKKSEEVTWLLRLKEVNIRPPLAAEGKYQRGRRKLPERPKTLPRNFPITISSEYVSVRDTAHSHNFLQSIKGIVFVTEAIAFCSRAGKFGGSRE